MNPLPLLLCYDLTWTECVLTFARRTSCIIILNPNSGPGTPKDPDFKKWQKLSKDLHELAAQSAKIGRKVTIYGYIDTVRWKGQEWQRRSKADLQSDGLGWVNHYGVRDGFFDDFFALEHGFKPLLDTFIPKSSIINPGGRVAREIWPQVAGVIDYEQESAQGISSSKSDCPPKTIRIGQVTDNSWTTHYDRAITAGLMAVALVDDKTYQHPPSFWRHWLKQSERDQRPAS